MSRPESPDLNEVRNLFFLPSLAPSSYCHEPDSILRLYRRASAACECTLSNSSSMTVGAGLAVLFLQL